MFFPTSLESSIQMLFFVANLSRSPSLKEVGDYQPNLVSHGRRIWSACAWSPPRTEGASLDFALLRGLDRAVTTVRTSIRSGQAGLLPIYTLVTTWSPFLSSHYGAPNHHLTLSGCSSTSSPLLILPGSSNSNFDGLGWRSSRCFDESGVRTLKSVAPYLWWLWSEQLAGKVVLACSFRCNCQLSPLPFSFLVDQSEQSQLV